MIGLGIRLSTGGGRESLARLLAIAGGVAIGVALLLFAISGLRIINGSAAKTCWQCTGRRATPPSETQNTTRDAIKHPILWSYSNEYYRGKTINRYDIALRASTTSTIPGINHLPKPGEYYASPALAKLIATAPHDQLADRFPGKMVGQIDNTGLNSPADLVAVVGRGTSELDPNSSDGSVVGVARIYAWPDSHNLGPFVTAMFVVAVGGILFAILTLIGTSTRLAAARREEKFAALRLLGATPRQINYFAAIDAALSAVAGAAVGLGLFYLVRSHLASYLSSDLVAFFPEDLTPGPIGSIAVLLGAPFLAALAAVLSLRKVRISPLGVARRTTPKPPRAWRIVPITFGLALLALVWRHNQHIVDSDVRGKFVPAFLLGFGLIIAGLVIVGPWLTMMLSKLLARYTKGASALLATRRLADNPSAAFRPISVMVIAVFLCTFIAGTAPILLKSLQAGGTGANNIMSRSQTFYGYDGADTSIPGIPASESRMRSALLESVPGVRVVPTLLDTSSSEGLEHVIVRCSDLALLNVKAFGLCTPGATAMQMQVGFEFNYLIGGTPFDTKAIHIPATALAILPTYSFVILTDGNPAHIDQLRTVLAQHPGMFSGSGLTWKEENAARQKMFSNLRLLINSGVILVLFVAGCSLAVAVAGGLIERKRPFGLLRVTGMSLGQLTRVVLYESAAPLLVAALAAIGAAILTTRVLISSFGERPVVIPPLGSDYYLLITGGLVAALAVLLATLPILAATTRPTDVRFE